MAKKYVGFESRLYIGTAGSTATTQLTNATDIDYTNDLEYGEVTVRGEGVIVPMKSERATCRAAEITFKYVRAANDAALATLLTAARAGTPLAVKYIDYLAGYGYDGDMIIKVKHNAPLKGEQTYEFTCVNNDDSRDAAFNGA